VNLAGAQLSGVDFSYANFYGDAAANPNGCATTGNAGAGFTNACASASASQMLGTKFTGAYLYGVDFAGATISGVSFDGAVLVGASFAGAKIGTDPNSGTRTTFQAAYLQGTNLDLATALGARLSDAFLDFESGNSISILLNGSNHNSFPCPSAGCSPATVADVCVVVPYPPSTVPGASTLLTCPDNAAAGASGCGPGRTRSAPGGVNERWASSLDIGSPPDLPPAWYSRAATYTAATPAGAPVLCGGIAKNPPVYFW
jgi:hypothetical protein